MDDLSARRRRVAIDILDHVEAMLPQIAELQDVLKEAEALHHLAAAFEVSAALLPTDADA